MTKNNLAIKHLNQQVKKILIIPAYNEEQTIGNVIREAKKHASVVLVVDDGSEDKTGEIAKNSGAIVVRHCINLGLGASLVTGFQLALRLGGEIIITLDADGQHRPEDIERIAAPILTGQADVVIGTRMKGSGNMPFSRKIYNYLANALTFFLYGQWASDSQSGFRAFRRDTLKKLRLFSQRMEISSEIIGEIKRQNLKLVEVSIPALYSNYSLSKGQSFLGGVKTAWALLLDRFHKS